MSKYYKLRRWLKKVQTFAINVIVIGLVLVVAVQIILANPDLKDSLISKVPKLNKILAIGQQSNFDAPAKKVFSMQSSQYEYLTISLQNKLKLSEVKLVINEQIVDNFADGVVKARIEEGDIIAIDARECNNGLWFKITNISTRLDTFESQEQFWVKNEYKVLGKIEEINKF